VAACGVCFNSLILQRVQAHATSPIGFGRITRGDIAERLLSALTAIGKYIGKVADTAIMSAAEGAGKTAGKLAVHAVGVTVLDRLLNNGRLLQFAKDLLGYASGG
jgi:predicted oxidoreductase